MLQTVRCSAEDLHLYTQLKKHCVNFENIKKSQYCFVLKDNVIHYLLDFVLIIILFLKSNANVNVLTFSNIELNLIRAKKVLALSKRLKQYHCK